MIFGIGTDIVEVKRFKKWVTNPAMINRFFNKEEQCDLQTEQKMCEHYAARFAAKEAFAKALGTGLVGFEFKEIYLKKDDLGKPILIAENSAKKILESRCGVYKIHISISHEKEYATAFAVIETL